jgi:mycofactocin precursor
MSPAISSDLRPAPVDATLQAELFDDSDELLVEEISIDGMCGVY